MAGGLLLYVVWFNTCCHSIILSVQSWLTLSVLGKRNTFVSDGASVWIFEALNDKLLLKLIKYLSRSNESLPEVVRVHVADVDEIGCTQSIQGVCWRLVEKPPASGKCRTLQPRVEHEPLQSQLQLHAGMGQIRHLEGKLAIFQVAGVLLLTSN